MAADAVTVTRSDVIAFRFHRHQLDRDAGVAPAADTGLLDLGVQDTGTDGSRWALALRGAEPAANDDLFLAWTIRGAPHAYRRSDVAAVTVATAPFSEADAASRVFDAARPLRKAGMPVLEALATIAREMRDIARTPVTKGEMSTALTDRLAPPFQRDCRPCKATHVYEQPFRLAALQAGLELEPGTSPPVLRRIPGTRPAPYRRLGTEAEPRLDVIRSYLRFFGPAPVKAIAAYLDAPVKDVMANLPEDAVEVTVDGLDGRSPRYLLSGDVDIVRGAADGARRGVVRLAGSHDPYLQLRDRELLVAETARHKDLWRTLGRPGAVLVDGEVAGTWRPRASAKSLALEVEPWSSGLTPAVRKSVQLEAERLAAHRGLALREVGGI